MWGRMSLRWSDLDFAANKKDGHGSDWPIRYADLKPWYDHVEAFAGISDPPRVCRNCPMAISFRR